MGADALYATPACTRTVITRFTMTHAGELLIEVPSVPVLKIDLVVQYELRKNNRTLETDLLFVRNTNFGCWDSFFVRKLKRFFVLTVG